MHFMSAWDKQTNKNRLHKLNAHWVLLGRRDYIGWKTHKMFLGGPRSTDDLEREGDSHKFTIVSVLIGLLHNRRNIEQEIRVENAQ